MESLPKKFQDIEDRINKILVDIKNACPGHDGKQRRSRNASRQAGQELQGPAVGTLENFFQGLSEIAADLEDIKKTLTLTTSGGINEAQRDDSAATPKGQPKVAVTARPEQVTVTAPRVIQVAFAPAEQSIIPCLEHPAPSKQPTVTTPLN